MYSSSSIDVRSYHCSENVEHADNCRSKLKGLIQRLGRHSAEHRDIAHMEHSQRARSSLSLAKSISSSSPEGMFSDDEMAWSRPSSRASSSGPFRNIRRHRQTRPAREGPAELLDDDNSAWARPSVGTAWRPTRT
ncbi:hypothetical protein BD311DRAFT_745039 [Dichomitus squalens]|uniref:Uncharacterized protein n=1 Tax=Dichomitus squalens TaxID=114155 RepID=A0A4Q9N6P9_9APHY|nr:hypothetical protein BD311DRAFT_745039 [Dichomitus squalens]